MRAAELSRRAGVLADAEERAGRQARPHILEIKDDKAPVQLDADSFPEAWAIPLNAPPKEVQAALNEMDNRTLAHMARATRDAVRLIETDPTLRDDFGRGLAVLTHDAKQRGVDVETGRHDPAKGADPVRARLHLDSGEHAIRVRVPLRCRQLVR